MRKSDKLKKLFKANILAENRYLESKGFMGEEIIDEDRTSMSEFFGETTDNVDTLLKMFAKYQPTSGWFMNVGYVNNVSNGTIQTSFKADDIFKFEEIVDKLDNPKLKRYADSMTGSEEWSSVKDKYGVDQERLSRGLKTPSKGKSVYKNPYSSVSKKNPETQKNEVVMPSKIYSSKNYTIKWDNLNQKADKDAEMKKVYDKHGLDWEEGAIDTDDWRGKGWEPMPGVPFSKHEKTKNKRLAVYSKGGVKSHKSKFFINFEDDIAELNDEETNFIFANSKDFNNKPMPRRLQAMENQEAASEIHALENAYGFKNLDLNKISYITCSMNINGENIRFSYVNRDAAPDGLDAGEFREFIEDSLPNSIS